MSVKVTYSTTGQSSPASVASGTGYYVYRGSQPDKPRRRSEPLPQNVKASASKQERVARYCAKRLEGKSKEQAAAEIGIHRSTARYYEAEFQDQQRGESRDG